MSQLTRAIRRGSWSYGVAGGTADALTVTLDPPLETYAAGLVLYLLISRPNMGPATINVDELGAVPIKLSAANLVPGDLMAGAVVCLVYDGSVFQLIGRSQGRLIGVQIFGSRGTEIYTPTPGMRRLIIEGQGAGGGGGGMICADNQWSPAGGGSSGSYATAMFTADQIGVSQVVTVGKGGSGGAAGNNGGIGGMSSFGTLMSCPGGLGGSGSVGGVGTILRPGASPGAAPSVGAGIITAVRGIQGGNGLGTGDGLLSGNGAGSPMFGGAGGGATVGVNTPGQPATAAGAGGGACGGVSAGALPGGDAWDGCFIIWEYS